MLAHPESHRDIWTHRYWRWVFIPILAPELRNRRIIFIFLAAAALHVGLTTAGLPAWICPIKSCLNVPCPGCGVSTAMALLIRGNYMAAVKTHAFAPIFLFMFSIVMAISFFPSRLHLKAIHLIAELERKTGFVAFLLLGMIVYWGFRLPVYFYHP
ncbi:DUF2752 domain-containing protein [Thermodesulfobacteriota bacterium]